MSSCSDKVLKLSQNMSLIHINPDLNTKCLLNCPQGDHGLGGEEAGAGDAAGPGEGVAESPEDEAGAVQPVQVRERHQD